MYRDKSKPVLMISKFSSLVENHPIIIYLTEKENLPSQSRTMVSNSVKAGLAACKKLEING